MCLSFVTCIMFLLDSTAVGCELAHSVIHSPMVVIEYLLCVKPWIFMLKAVSYSSLELPALAQLPDMLVEHIDLKTHILAVTVL